MWVVTWIGVLGASSGLGMLALAVALLAGSTESRQARSLALLVALYGAQVFFGDGVLYVTDDHDLGFAAQLMAFALIGAVPAASLLFVGTLPSRFGRPFSGPVARAILYVCMLLSTAAVYAAPRSFLSDVGPGPYTPLDAVTGPRFDWLLLGLAVSALYGFIVAAHAWRTAPRGGPLRRNNGLVALAFSVPDAFSVGSAALAALLEAFGHMSPAAFFILFALLTVVAGILFTGLLAYAVLRGQVFDIDLRLKKGLGRSAVVALIAIVFFVVSEVSQTLLSVRGFWPGLAAAALITLAFLPLQRAVGRLLDRWWPSSQDTPEYRRRKKDEVVQAALEYLAADGRLDAADRAQVADLRERLGLPAGERVVAADRQITSGRRPSQRS